MARPRTKAPRRNSPASIRAEAALSFLKDAKGTLSWSTQDLEQSLKISSNEGEQVIAVLQAQGYVQPHGKEWLTTPAGEAVSGTNPPRLTRESVQKALASLKERIKQRNKEARRYLKSQRPSPTAISR